MIQISARYSSKENWRSAYLGLLLGASLARREGRRGGLLSRLRRLSLRKESAMDSLISKERMEAFLHAMAQAITSLTSARRCW